MEHIIGFRWHLPLAFRSSISQCRFEQGDIIYLEKPLGKKWEEEIQFIDYLIQVKSPTRSVVTSQQDDSNIFRSNWDSPVIFEKIHPNNHGLNKTIETTQGKLFSFLWRNDENILENKDSLTPVIISSQIKYSKPQQLTKSRTIGWINKLAIINLIPDNCFGFATIYDQSSELSEIKRQKIKSLFEKFTNQPEQLFSCDELITKHTDLKEFPKFSPTLRISLYIADKTHNKEIQSELKKFFYKGEKGRFRIGAHGLLID